MLCTRKQAGCWRYRYTQHLPGLSSLYIRCRLLKHKIGSFPILMSVSSHRTSVGARLSSHSSLVLALILPAAWDVLRLHTLPTSIRAKGCASPFKIQVEHLLSFWSCSVPPPSTPGPCPSLGNTSMKALPFPFAVTCSLPEMRVPSGAGTFSSRCPKSPAGCLARDSTQ